LIELRPARKAKTASAHTHHGARPVSDRFPTIAKGSAMPDPNKTTQTEPANSMNVAITHAATKSAFNIMPA